MSAIKDRNTGEVIEIVEAREMGWCIGGFWLVTKDGFEIPSYEVDFPNSPNRRESARYEALPAKAQNSFSDRGQGLIEILVVIAIVALVAAIAGGYLANAMHTYGTNCGIIAVCAGG